MFFLLKLRQWSPFLQEAQPSAEVALGIFVHWQGWRKTFNPIPISWHDAISLRDDSKAFDLFIDRCFNLHGTRPKTHLYKIPPLLPVFPRRTFSPEARPVLSPAVLADLGAVPLLNQSGCGYSSWTTMITSRSSDLALSCILSPWDHGKPWKVTECQVWRSRAPHEWAPTLLGSQGDFWKKDTYTHDGTKV